MNLRNVIDKSLAGILISLMALMVINVLWQVASRYLLSSPSSFTDELSRYLLIWVGLLGASYVTGKKMHLAIDIIPSKLEEKKARSLNIFINVVVALFALFVMVWGGANLVYITFILEQYSPALNLPLAYVYMVIPLSGILIIYYSFHNLTLSPPSPEEQGEEISLN